ncbi:MAG: response regulator transcription factor [Acidobacteria bacterium]|nr:response regulator transcription factor [Acidobacteriota bacterium]
MVNLVLVDDHELVRTGIKVLLERTGEFRVLADTSNAAEGIAACKQMRPHLAVLDLSIPGLDGIEATGEILRSCPETRVVILTAYQQEATVVSAIRAGASGYVLKRATTEELIQALRSVVAGGVYLSPEVSHCLYGAIQRDSGASKSNPLARLTAREIQVLRLVARGLPNKDIATTMSLSPETVRSYRKSMMKKLGVHNAASLTQLAIRGGLLDRFEEVRPHT